MLHTEIGKTYWNEEGIYQSEYDELYNELVPASGSAQTLNGELIRAISRLSYEYFNNGNCNACERTTHVEEEDCPYCMGYGYLNNDEDDVCEECGGSGVIEEEVEDDPVIDDYYAKFLRLIRECVSVDEVDVENLVDNVESVILKSEGYYTPELDEHYTRLADAVIYYVLTHEDESIPMWYEIG